MDASKRSLAARFLLWMAEAILHHRGWFSWPHLVLAVACVVYFCEAGVSHATQRLVGAEGYHHIFVEAEFPTEDDIVVVVESERGEEPPFVERLGQSRRSRPMISACFLQGRSQDDGAQGVVRAGGGSSRMEDAGGCQPFRANLAARRIWGAINLITQIRTREERRPEPIGARLAGVKRIVARRMGCCVRGAAIAGDQRAA